MIPMGEKLVMLDPADMISAAIHSAFVKYPRDDDPEWRHQGISEEDSAYLAKVILLELKANGFEIIRRGT
jgi:hypothetical protein